MAAAMKGADLYDPASAPRALQKLREVKYSTFWKPLKDFPIRPSSFERLNRIKIARENLEEYMATAMEFEKAVKAEGNDFNLGIFQPFGGGYSEQVFHVRGSHANSEDAGDIIDRRCAKSRHCSQGSAVWGHGGVAFVEGLGNNRIAKHGIECTCREAA